MSLNIVIIYQTGLAGRVRPGRCFGLYMCRGFEERMRKYQARRISPLPRTRVWDRVLGMRRQTLPLLEEAPCSGF